MFMLFAPLLGERHVFVREQRTRKDFAQVIKGLLDEIHPQAEKIVLVMDQLNTHGVASLLRSLRAAGGAPPGRTA
jgi:ATP/maltotriose-dependent transcriptional regulator MalT